MAKKHEHKALSEQSTDRCWIYCVTPRECAANPRREEAHGNVTQHDVCSCGARRLAEFNGGRTNYGPWEVQEPGEVAE